MKRTETRFVRHLDRLSGTYPNDERTSRINEKGFALIGLVYIVVLVFRVLHNLLFPLHYKPESRLNDTLFDKVILGIMLLIMLVITVRQRRQESPAQSKKKMKLRIADLPAAAAALLMGKRPADERTVHAFERGFAVCALIGLTYFSVWFLLFYLFWNRYFWTTMYLLIAAPVLLGIVKLRENILTRPRVVHIPLSLKHLLLRLPVYFLVLLPFMIALSFALGSSKSLDPTGGGTAFWSSRMSVLLLQTLGIMFKAWIRDPFHIPKQSPYYFAMIYLGVAVIYEFIVWIYKKQMKKMDDEENDLS